MGEQIMQQFSGKSVLVTGAASGIGRATMERLARSGARVLACDINEAGLRDAAAALVAEGREVITRPLDVTDEQACRDAVRSEEHTSELQSRGHLVCRLLHE